MTTVHQPAPRTASIARCSRVSREYRRDGDRSGWLGRRSRAAPTVTALDGVDFAVAPGEFVGVSGPSGSGKSTLLHLLAALDTPTSGTVELAGRNVGDLSERRRARLRLEHVGVVFQRFYLVPSLSARANVALPLVARGVGRRERRRRAADLLREVGLGDREGHRPGELSGGEQQRVAIARALANEPSLLIADEPTGEVDSETGRRIVELLADVGTDRAVVMATHDRDALGAADRIVRLRDGRVVADG